MFSTTMMVESIMMPKSTAPSDNRFTGVPLRWSRIKAPSIASGMLIAAIIAVRRLPRKNSKMKKTSTIPSNRFSDGTKRGIDQSGAVIVRYYLIALRQHSCCIELVDLLPHPLQRLEGVAVLAHQDGAGDDLILIVHSDDPEPRRPSNRNVTHITNPDWRGLVAGEHDVANVVEGMDKTYSTHIKSLLTDVKVAAAGVGV